MKVGFLLVLASGATCLAFIHHITGSIQVSAIVAHLGDETTGVGGLADGGIRHSPEFRIPPPVCVTT